MAQDVKLILYPVTDTEKAKAIFSKFLGVDPYADSPYYIGYKTGNLEVGLVPNSKDNITAYTETKDIKASLAAMTEVGTEIVQEPKDVGGGLLVASVKDGDGNILGFRQQPIES